MKKSIQEVKNYIKHCFVVYIWLKDNQLILLNSIIKFLQIESDLILIKQDKQPGNISNNVDIQLMATVEHLQIFLKSYKVLLDTLSQDKLILKSQLLIKYPKHHMVKNYFMLYIRAQLLVSKLLSKAKQHLLFLNDVLISIKTL